MEKILERTSVFDAEIIYILIYMSIIRKYPAKYNEEIMKKMNLLSDKNENELAKMDEYLSNLLSFKTKMLILHETLCDIALGQCDLLVTGKNKKVNFNSIQIVIEDMHPEVIGVGYVKGIVKRIHIKELCSLSEKSGAEKEKALKENTQKLTSNFVQYDYFDYQCMQRQLSMIFSDKAKYIGFAKIIDDNDPNFYIVCFLVLEAIGNRDEAYDELVLNSGEKLTLSDSDLDASAIELFGSLPPIQRSISRREEPKVTVVTSPGLSVTEAAATFSSTTQSIQQKQSTSDIGVKSVSNTAVPAASKPILTSSSSNPLSSPVSQITKASSTKDLIKNQASSSESLELKPQTSAIETKKLSEKSSADSHSTSGKSTSSVSSWFGALLRPLSTSKKDHSEEEKAKENPWAEVKLKSVQNAPASPQNVAKSETKTENVIANRQFPASPQENLKKTTQASSATAVEKNDKDDKKKLESMGDSFRERTDSQKTVPSWAAIKLNPVSSPLSRNVSEKSFEGNRNDTNKTTSTGLQSKRSLTLIEEQHDSKTVDSNAPIVSPLSASSPSLGKRDSQDFVGVKPSISEIKKKFENSNSSPISPEIGKKSVSSRTLQQGSPSGLQTTTPMPKNEITSTANAATSEKAATSEPKAFNLDEIRKKFGSSTSKPTSTS